VPREQVGAGHAAGEIAFSFGTFGVVNPQDSSGAPAAGPALFTFPRFLSKLDYVDRLSWSDRARRSVHPIETVAYYVQHMSMGMAYQRHVVSPLNRNAPNRLTSEDLRNAMNLHSRGWSWSDVSEILDVDFPELASIPVDADLLATDSHDEPLAGLLHRLCLVRGIEIANATKFLHQKRPALVPILDAYARRSLNVPWLRSYEKSAYQSVFRTAFSSIRELCRDEANRVALEGAEAWLGEEAVERFAFTRVRIIDILAWQVVQREG
jgi:hypothetical protein